MDRAKRLDAVRQRVIMLRDHAVEAKEAGPACWKCRFYGYTYGTCKSDVVAGLVYKPEMQLFNYGSPISASAARSEDGLCGPEALLFEAKTASPYITAAIMVSAGLATFLGTWIVS